MDNFLLISLFLILSISPFIVAHYTKHKRKVLILVLGLLTGWTIIGSIALNTYALLSSMKFKILGLVAIVACFRSKSTFLASNFMTNFRSEFLISRYFENCVLSYTNPLREFANVDGEKEGERTD